MAAPVSSASSIGIHSSPQQQASLRDYLNERMAPFLKQALKQSLTDGPEYPLRYLGEYLINQSLLHEKDPQKTEIRNHFQYSFDKSQPPATQESNFLAGSEPDFAYSAESVVEQLNEAHPVNGSVDDVVATNTNGSISSSERGINISPTQGQGLDTEMGGTS